MAAPRQMTAHTLEAPKGWPSPSAVDCVAKLAAAVTIDPVFAGRVVRLNADLEFEMGLPTTVGLADMPIFLFQNADDPDVQNDGGDPATEAGVWVAVAPVGNMMGLVAVGAYELASTEFQPESSLGDTYDPGDGLTATASNSNATTGGRITKGTPYAVPLCGVVSKGVQRNSHGKDELWFWPVWLPRNNAGA